MKYEIVVPYATETTTQMYKYYWWSEQWLKEQVHYLEIHQRVKKERKRDKVQVVDQSLEQKVLKDIRKNPEVRENNGQRYFWI